MFKKEFFDSLFKTLYVLGILFISLITGFIFIRLSGAFEVSFNQTLCITLELLLLFVSFYIGISIFGEEKKQNTFEYLLSLPYSRLRILFNKLVPRLAILLVLLAPYFIFVLLIASDPLLLNPDVFLPAYATFFIFSVSISLIKSEGKTVLNYLIILFCSMVVFVFTNISALIETLIFSARLDLLLLEFKSGKTTYIPLILFCVFLFGGFVYTFKGLELSILFSRFQKNVISRIFYILATFIFIFIIINVFDTPKVRSFSEKDLLHGRLDKNNGYIKFLTVLQNPGVDIDSNKVINKYINLMRPQKDPGVSEPLISYKKARQMQKKAIEMLSTERSHWNVIMQRFKIDMGKNYIDDSAAKLLGVLQRSKDINIYLDRINQLLDYNHVVDICLIDSFYAFYREFRQRQILVKLYLLANTTNHNPDQQVKGIKNILQLIEFSKKLVKGSRSYSGVWTGREMVNLSLSTLLDITARRNTPGQVREFIYRNLPEFIPGDFSVENMLIFDGFTYQKYLKDFIYETKEQSILNKIIINLFLHENRSMNMIYEATRHRIKIEKMLPYKTRSEISEINSANPVNQTFWWLFNPIGKSIVDKYSLNRFHYNYRIYRFESLYNLTKIAIEAYYKYNPEIKDIAGFIKGLDSYKMTLDPFSGEPFRYNPKKQILYSIGWDFQDGKGLKKYRDIIVELNLGKNNVKNPENE